MKETIRAFGHGDDADGEKPPDAGKPHPQPAAPAKKSVAQGNGSFRHWFKLTKKN